MLAATPGAGFWLNLRQREAWRPVRIGGLVATLPDRFLAIPGASRPPTQLTREAQTAPVLSTCHESRTRGDGKHYVRRQLGGTAILRLTV
jgi:hypothetical protein